MFLSTGFALVITIVFCYQLCPSVIMLSIVDGFLSPSPYFCLCYVSKEMTMRSSIYSTANLSVTFIFFHILSLCLADRLQALM